MDYAKHYSILIERSRGRDIEGYTEKHHIVPRCMGGTDELDNIVRLTPEEHYVAHQLLVKIYPEHKGLVSAAVLMCSSSKNHTRRTNKLYGWLKKNYSTVCKQRVGNKNGSFGTRWVTDGINPIKISRDAELPDGYVEGRTIKVFKKCTVCGVSTNSTKSLFCDSHRHKRKDTDPNEVLEMYESGVPMQEILDKYGWKVEQNVTSYLSKNFPNRKKFLPKERSISR